MKLSQHPKFPKERNLTFEIASNYVDKIKRGDGEDNVWLEGEVYGYNQALRELGELEILEPLEEVKVESCIHYHNFASKAYSMYKSREEYLQDLTSLANNICSYFGTKKVSVGEIEKVLKNCLDSPTYPHKGNKHGSFYDRGYNFTIDSVRKDLAEAIVEYINKEDK